MQTSAAGWPTMPQSLPYVFFFSVRHNLFSFSLSLFIKEALHYVTQCYGVRHNLTLVLHAFILSSHAGWFSNFPCEKHDTLIILWRETIITTNTVGKLNDSGKIFKKYVCFKSRVNSSLGVLPVF